MLSSKRLSVALTLIAGLCTTTSTLAAPPIDYVEGQILVKGKAGLPDVALEKILSKSKGRAVSKLGQIGVHIVEVPPQAEDAVIRALSKHPHIDFAEKDMLVEHSAVTPNDPKYSIQWHLPKIQAPTAWDTTAGEGVTVAILDTGVEGSHPDLVGNLVPGWNVVSNNSNTSPIMWHGTSVAGTTAATGNNATGGASVAWNASIMPIRITNASDGWASYSDLANGVLWAADHGARVANISYELSNPSSTLSNAAQYMRNKGGVVVVAAGNSNTDGGYSDNPYMITVAATTSSDAKASFSNYGDQIDISAPGKDIYTVYTNGGYTYAYGTSFATPVASGVVALIMAANPRLSPAEVEAILEESADDLGSNGWDPVFGHGRVNADAAVMMAAGGSTSDTLAPEVIVVSPAYNSTVSGSVLVDVDASDNIGVTTVALYANGQNVGSDNTAPYEFSWDSTRVSDGNATLTAYAYDAAGNTGISSAIAVNVENQADPVDSTPPSVSILSPSASSTTVSGTVTVSVSASDDTAVTKVELLVNGNVVGTDNTAPYQFDWDTTQVADGQSSLLARAYDAASNIGESASMSVVVDNAPNAVDTLPPSVTISNPAQGETVSGTVSIKVNATDDTGVTGLSVYIDNALKCSIGDSSSLSCNWNTRKEAAGDHVIKAIATDAAGHSTVTSITVSAADNTKGGGGGRGKKK